MLADLSSKKQKTLDGAPGGQRGKLTEEVKCPAEADPCEEVDLFAFVLVLE